MKAVRGRGLGMVTGLSLCWLGTLWRNEPGSGFNIEWMYIYRDRHMSMCFPAPSCCATWGSVGAWHHSTINNMLTFL